VSSDAAIRHEDPCSWSPLVYGRTRLVDGWWRALPQPPPDQWLSEMVFAAVAGGRSLTSAGQPRYLLARDATRVLLGIACAAASVSAAMNADKAGRSLYTLVGWTAGDPTAAIPPLASFKEHALSWASIEYTRWLTQTWEKPDAPVITTPSGPAPWQPSAILDNPYPLHVKTGFTLIVPAMQAEQLWEAVRASREPAAIVVGWRRWIHADLRMLTAVSADDADLPMTIRAGTGSSPARLRRPGGRVPAIEKFLTEVTSRIRQSLHVNDD
jgi:hypothetical protein